MFDRERIKYYPKDAPQDNESIVMNPESAFHKIITYEKDTYYHPFSWVSYLDFIGEFNNKEEEN